MVSGVPRAGGREGETAWRRERRHGLQTTSAERTLAPGSRTEGRERRENRQRGESGRGREARQRQAGLGLEKGERDCGACESPGWQPRGCPRQQGRGKEDGRAHSLAVPALGAPPGSCGSQPGVPAQGPGAACGAERAGTAAGRWKRRQSRAVPMPRSRASPGECGARGKAGTVPGFRRHSQLAFNSFQHGVHPRDTIRGRAVGRSCGWRESPWAAASLQWLGHAGSEGAKWAQAP